MRWSPYELSVGRGLTVDSGLIESETHPTPVVLNYNLRVFTVNIDVAHVTINYGMCFQFLQKKISSIFICKYNWTRKFLQFITKIQAPQTNCVRYLAFMK